MITATAHAATKIALDEAQRRAVTFGGRRLRVTGGPATGKTTGLLERAAHLVEDRGVDPEGILIFVGDRRHAVRLRDALVRRVGRSMVRPSVHTFHGFAWWLLTRAFTVETPSGPESELGYALAGLEQEPVLLTAFDQRARVGGLLRAENPEDWRVYPHVLVDDFEEANRAEAALLEALIPTDDETDRSAVVFGDPNGTVFTFRGADPACLEGLPVEDMVELTTRYRTTSDTAVNLYSHLTEEARAAVAELRRHHARGLPWGTMGIVLRDYHTLLAPLRRELHRAGVPYRVEGEALGLADDPVVKPVLDFFSIACGRMDSENLWPGVLSSDIGGLSSTELIELRRSARLAGVPVHEICGADRLPEGLPPSVARKVEALCALVTKAREWAQRMRPDECFWRLWQAADTWASLVTAGDDRRLDSLTTLADALGRFSDRHGSGARIADFIDTLVSAEFTPESVRLVEPSDAVTITTAHGAKSTEFEFAVVAGCVEGLWPDPSRRGVAQDVVAQGKNSGSAPGGCMGSSKPSEPRY